MEHKGIYHNSFSINVFGQLAKLNNFIVNQDAKEPTENSLLEFEKNDQLISRSESEHRIFVMFAIASFINCFIITTLSIITNKTSNTEPNIMEVEIPIVFKMAHLQAIHKNGTVFSSHFDTHLSSIEFEYLFDLPSADLYSSFEYRQKLFYVHGKGHRQYFFQTFKNIHGKARQRKHEFTGEAEIDHSYIFTTGFNSSVAQIGSFLMFFGGGHDWDDS